MLRQAEQQVAAQTSQKNGALGVAIVLGLTVAIYVPFYIRAKRRGDLSDAGTKMHGDFCEKQIASKSRFAKGSFRYKRSGRAWVLIGCPKGQWMTRGARCRVGTRAYKVLVPAAGGCPRGSKRIAK